LAEEMLPQLFYLPWWPTFNANQRY